MKRIFFLGGCDLEMCAIKRLLKKYNEKFVDKKLKWGAKTSDILDELEKYRDYDKIYLIEYNDDAGILKWENVEHIDHHNENSDKPSSIEQIAQILDHKLSRFEKAVALNDKGYIPALKCACFNKSDIKRIRKLDKICQGVSEEAEKAAEKVELKKINYFPFSHFSPLADRLYFSGIEKFVIFNDNFTMFYGYPAERLKEIFKNRKTFYGGGNHGYFGVEEKLSEDEIKEAIKEDKEKEISTHIFILPFFIEGKDEKEAKDAFIKKLEENGFEKKKFDVTKPQNYNEYVYFHSYTKEVLFDSYYLELKLPKNSKYIIKLKSGDIYELDIEDIAVRIFENNIAMLSFHLNNYKYSHPKDILKINDFGRRIFPQYIREDDILAAKDSFLPDCIELKFGKKVIREDFCKFIEDFNIKKNKNLLIPKFVSEFVGEKIKYILDDRMFVVSFYIAPNWLINELKKDYIKNDWWYEYVFVDGNGKTCQDDEFCLEIIKKATYPRWRNYGTLWGVSRYSLVGVANEGGRFLMDHVKTMYFQMASLVLLYRSMILNLSDEVKKIIILLNKKDENIDISKIREISKKIYKDYLEFLNGIFFREITAQEQGIEMYKMLLNASDIDALLQSFDREMEELDNFIDILEEKERNENLEFLSILGAVFLPAGFIVGVLGISSLDKIHPGVTFVLIFASIIAGFLFIDRKKIKSFIDEDNKKKGQIFVGIIFLIFILIIIFSIGNFKN